jgi:hypothetical protein
MHKWSQTASPLCASPYVCLCQPVMKLLHVLGNKAAGPVGVDRASLVAGALHKLSVGLCRGNFLGTMHVWEYLQSPVGLGSGLACE